MSPEPDEPPAPPKPPATFTLRVYEYDENKAVKEARYAPSLLGTLQLPWKTRLVLREEDARVAVRARYKRDCNVNHCPDHSLVATIRIALRR